jgi:DNA-binding transcriptional regulator YhcF (GntR family)
VEEFPAMNAPRIEIYRKTQRQQVYELLHQMIASSGQSEGDRLPSISQLAQQFGTSPRTVHLALEDLETKGYVAMRHGAGTFIASKHRPLGMVDTVAVCMETSAHLFGDLSSALVNALNERRLVPLVVNTGAGKSDELLTRMAYTDAACFLVHASIESWPVLQPIISRHGKPVITFITTGGRGDGFRLYRVLSGFLGGPASGHGYGPGRGYYSGVNDGTGGGYGGMGGGCYNTPTTTRGTNYGSATQPRQPGSGGGGCASSSGGGRGGGLVWLNIGDTVTLQGTITADGGNGFDANVDGGGGSGGGINITCTAFDGSAAGSMTANGGGGYERGGAGGGGRIAVRVLQTLLWAYTNQCEVFAGTGYASAYTAQVGTVYWEIVAPQLSVGDTNVYEGPSASTTPMYFMASLSKTSDSPVSVAYSTSNGTGIAGVDYLATNGTLTIPAGQMAATAEVVVVGNDTEEYGYKTVYLVLSNAVGGALQNGTAEGRILDDDDQPNETVWTGTNDWDTPANWSPGLPGGLDTAIVRSGNCKISGNYRAFHVIVTNAATVTFTSWDGVLRATNVTVLSGGVITHEANTDQNNLDGWTPDRRIHIVCSNLTIDAGGKIDTKGKGYHGYAGSYGCGPGGGSTTMYGGGGSYGGRGGYGVGGNASGATYGDALWPTNPGSSGGGTWSAAGGAILVEAAGAATVNGDISADAADVNASWEVDHWRYGWGGGSGGSVLIDCATLGGAGAIHADGQGGWPCGGGGGGRIALRFAAHASDARLTLGANRGLYCENGIHTPGTLWLSEGSILAGTLTNRHGIYVNPCDYHLPRLVLSNCLMTLSLSNATFCAATNLELAAGTTLTLQSGPTNASGSWTAYGGAVEVTNALSVGANSTLALKTDPVNGGAIRIMARSVTVLTNGTISADSSGYQGGQTNGATGFGPGGGTAGTTYRAAGAGYGGRGGYAQTGSYGVPGEPYGSRKYPRMSGSGGGKERYGSSAAGRGGGLVWIETSGDVSLYGTISANGGGTTYNSTSQSGAGSGGGIYIVCNSLCGSSNGWLRAEGGAALGGVGTSRGGGGGGGRIAVWTMGKVRWEYAASRTSVVGGDGYYAAGTEYGAQPGTVYWGQRLGTIIMLQ